MAGIDNAAILLKSDYQFKVPLTENYILQQLRGQFDEEPRYFSDKSGEIDFLLQNGLDSIPVEAISLVFVMGDMIHGIFKLYPSYSLQEGRSISFNWPASVTG